MQIVVQGLEKCFSDEEMKTNASEISEKVNISGQGEHRNAA